ncbi:MAG TPA: hypothetical protein VKU38_04395 [Ktedonobacteraceae bacterium]|nr:hypothetical protein [Ktedonobacteraceae bacterium]
MPGRWDTSTKRLVNTRPEDFIRWLIPGAQFIGPVEARSLNLNNQEIEADNLNQMIVDGIKCLIHIEFQSYTDEHMAERMWKYNAMATWTYDCPTDSFVIYLRRCKVSEPFFRWKFPPAKMVHLFHFNVVKLWEVSFEEIEQAGLLGLLPLMVLARGGKNRKVVEKAITTIETSEDEDRRDLLSLTYIFASMAFVKETDRHWLKRRFRMFEDALKDSWAYQEIWQGGKLEGKQEERLANVQRQRHMLEYLVEKDFPALMPLAKKRGEASDDPDALQALIFALLRAGNEQEAKQLLSQEN